MTSPAGSASGVLVVDKPAGITSHAAVAEVARRLRAVRAGHAGTLDPMATGVLLVCLGEATKIAGLLLGEDKAYEGELELGRETDTLDAEGQVVRERPAEAAAIHRVALAAAMARFLGPGQQVPPMYSAVRQGGRRLHQLARAGHEVERAPRPVIIRRFDLLSFDPPRARFAVDCSKGTYVRSLVADLGEALGCGAHLTALRRTRSGGFGLDRAIPLAGVNPDAVAAPGCLVSPAEALAHLPQVVLSPAHERAVATGKPMLWKELSPLPAPSDPVCLLTSDGHLLALIDVEAGRVRYRRVLPRTSPQSAP
jgi:tRNA pseudouridine55 synthase